jgi:aminoglycoside phosphotransferase (APT) family kinase protein
VGLGEVYARYGTVAGAHSLYRGGSLANYDEQTHKAISALAREFDASAVTEVWEAPISTTWKGDPVWVHGGAAASNLLVKEDQLCLVIEFGCASVRDPSCDLVVN